MALVILYFLVTFLAFLVFGSLFLSNSLSIDISPHRFNFIFNTSFSLWFFYFCQVFFVFFGLNSSLDATLFAQAYNIVLTSFISSSLSSKIFWIAKFAKLRYISCGFFTFTFVRFSRFAFLNEVYSMLLVFFQFDQSFFFYGYC